MLWFWLIFCQTSVKPKIVAYSQRFAWLRAFRFRECVTDRVCVWNVFLFGPKSLFFNHRRASKEEKEIIILLKINSMIHGVYLFANSTFWFGLKVSHFCINKNQTTTFLFWVEMIMYLQWQWKMNFIKCRFCAFDADKLKIYHVQAYRRNRLEWIESAITDTES